MTLPLDQKLRFAFPECLVPNDYSPEFRLNDFQLRILQDFAGFLETFLWTFRLLIINDSSSQHSKHQVRSMRMSQTRCG